MDEKLRQLKWVDGILGMGLLLLAIGIGINVSEKLKQPTATLVKGKITPTGVIQGDNKVMFDIGGGVLNPGVYKLNKGARIGEALAAANGLSADADREWVERNINRAELIRDGMKIYIPSLNDKAPVQILGEKIININTADISELDKLAGVGPALAQRIIDYREKNGGFKDVNEIKMVSGIGDKLFEKIKGLVGI